MSFYLRPPKGMANLKNLEDSVRQRSTCYESIFSENVKEVILELECLIEDSVLDRLGHSIFRLAALKNSLFHNIFLKNEIKLLDIRLSCYKKEDVKYFIKKLNKQTMVCLEAINIEGQAKEFFTLLTRIFLQFLKKGYLEHAFFHEPDPCQQCQHYEIKVPWDFCPDLLSTREYNISKGTLQIPCFKWKNLVLSLYKTTLLLTLNEIRYLSSVCSTLEDERVQDMIELTKRLCLKNNPNHAEIQGNFKLDTFEQESNTFPLCMRNLHNILRKNNRLSHNARFEFSLYLKGIGLSLSDSFKFWENAYSKQHASCSKCTHSWQENEKRYIYGIRHLYGLEGSRKNYSAKSCHQIQDITLGANDEGGCPFQHFDDDNLRIALKNCLPNESNDQIEIIINKRKENAKIGCELYFAEYLENIFKRGVSKEAINFQNPVQYYVLTRDILNA